MDMKTALSDKASVIDGIIENYLPKEEGYQKTVFEAMNYSIRVGGKRLRPILMLETYKLFGGSSKAIEPFMAAIEMIHTYSLVHDDLPAMDNDLLRRGKPTTHAVYGECMAILAGDALLNYAFETAIGAFELDPCNPAVAKSLGILARKAGIYGMIGGQVVDIESEDLKSIEKDRLDFIYRLKTSALIESAMMIGALLGGADDSQLKLIEQVATSIGLAFQIQDDILDVSGDEAKLGKPIGSDEKNNKSTYVTFEGLDNSKCEVKRLTDLALNKLHELPCENAFLDDLLEYLIYRDN